MYLLIPVHSSISYLILPLCDSLTPLLIAGLKDVHKKEIVCPIECIIIYASHLPPWSCISIWALRWELSLGWALWVVFGLINPIRGRTICIHISTSVYKKSIVILEIFFLAHNVKDGNFAQCGRCIISFLKTWLIASGSHHARTGVSTHP